MNTFLKEVAQHLHYNYSNDLSRLVVMFPSLRARAFFNDALSDVAKKTIWQPHYTSIDEVMERASGLKRVDQIRLLSELYNVYKERFTSETFDHFYHWGCVLLSDFDMIDKYMVNAELLLVNISDLKEIEADVSYLTPEQKDIIKSFWNHLQNNQDIDDLSIQKKRFLEMWKALPYIYKNFRSALLSKHIGYPGLIYRTAAERIINNETVDIEPRRFIIAGFNALSKSEQILFDYLSKREEGAEFYWDYDEYYVNNPKIDKHEAGYFISKNIKKFPSLHPIAHNHFAMGKEHISSTACVSNIAQVKHIEEILKSLPGKLDKNTAIVLTDENLLIPLLHSLPEGKDIGKNEYGVNVTMGYPLKNTLTYSLIELLITLQTHSRTKDGAPLFYHKDVTWILSHPFITDICGDIARKKSLEIISKHVVMTDTTLLSVEVPQKTKSDKQLQEFENAKELFSKLFIKTEDWKSLADYIINILNQTSSQYNSDNAEDNDNNTEHRRVAIEEISKLKNLVEDCNIPLTTETFISLLRRHLQAKTISYEGKPLDGIQVLGILETRNLDFENVIILSMTDANFPGNHTNQASLIPYNLRYAYEMPTPEQHEAMYAYYFYRLLQRAKRVHMLYCSCANEKSTGECSRYIYQLDFEYGGIEKRTLGVDLSIEENGSIEVKKDDEIMNALMQYTGRRDQNAKDKLPTFSPTALFRYVECPLKFYFASIAKLHSLNEFDDKIDSLTLGKIIHKSMENLYEKHKIVGMRNPKESIEALRKDSIIKPIVDEAIGEILYNNANTTTKDYTGDTLLVRDIIIKYIKDGILAHDAKRDDYTISGLEKEIKCGFMTSKGVIVNFQGIADRIDTLADGTKQIIDYKSGYKPHLEFNGFDNLFNGNNEQRISNIFQTLLYSMIVNRSENVDVKPSLFYAACMVDNLDYSPYIWIIEKEGHNIIERYTQVSKQFEEKLRGVLDELFDQEKPFTQVGDKKFCKLCDYNKICKRDDPS